MRSYDPKEWKRIILDFHKSDTLRKLLPILFAAGLYAGIIAFLEIRYMNSEEKT